MQITVIGVGKIKEAYFTMGIKEYSKRLSRYCKLNIIEVQDEKTPDGAGKALEEQIKKKEGERILKNISENSYVVALALEGTMLDSVELAEKTASLLVGGVSHITFLIGGSLGLDSVVLDRADYLLSFSKMTFPHQMMRLILLEQIYRSCRINSKEPYHK